MANQVAYGFMTLEDVFDRRVADFSVQTIEDAMMQTVELHNQVWEGMSSSMIDITVTPKESYQVPGSGTLQPLSEEGVPVPTRQFKKYDVGYPIQRGGDAWGTTREARAKMTVADINANVLNVMLKDFDWLQRHALAALLDNTSWSYSDENDNIGTLTIKPLANDDTDTYPVMAGAGASQAADDHYLASASTWNDSNRHHETIFAELDEHPGNMGPYALYVPTGLVNTVKALGDFIESPFANVQYGQDTTLAGTLPPGLLAFGDKYLGTLGDFYVIRARRLPANYVIGLAAGGGKPLAMREHPEAELRGLHSTVHRVNSNFEKVDYYRYAGFGVRNRVGAAVMYLGGGAYVIPTGFATPLPV